MKKTKFVTHKKIWNLLSGNRISSSKLPKGQINFLKAVKAISVPTDIKYGPLADDTEFQSALAEYLNRNPEALQMFEEN